MAIFILEKIKKLHQNINLTFTTILKNHFIIIKAYETENIYLY